MHVGRLLSGAATAHPDRVAWDERGPVTYREAERRVNRIANALLGLGLARGARVGIIAWNSPAYIETMLAVMRAGLCVVPLNVRLHPSEHAELARDAELGALAYDDALAEHVERVNLPDMVKRIRIGGSAGASPHPTLESLIERASDACPRDEPSAGDLAWIFYTSGTTGTPKGAMLTHRNLLTLVASNLAEMGPTTADDAVLHAIPLSHAGGFFMLHHVARGARHAFMPSNRFDPESFCATVRTKGATAVALLPTMINMVLATGDAHTEKLRSLRLVCYGGTPMPRQRLEEGIARLGPIFLQSYGLGEAPMTATVLRREDHRGEALITAGRPTPFTAARIQDEEGQPVSLGERGEIALKGDLVMAGYWRNPGASTDVIRDGWFRTGDIGAFDDSGLLHLLDRKKDMIKTGGATVSPREVEDVIYQHPSIHEVAVIGVPDEQWGESIRAVCVLKPGMRADATEIVDVCVQRIASFKKPKFVEFVAELPKAPSGKVMRRELRERYWVGHDRKIG